MKQHTLYFDKAVSTWDEAIPLGNGAIGCLIWGEPNSLRLSLDRCDLWDTADAPEIGGEFTYSNLVHLAKEGNEKEIERIFDKPYSKPRPTKLPAGRILLDLGNKECISSALCIEEAVATIRSGSVILNGFIDANNEVGIFKVNSKCKFIVQNPEFGLIGDEIINDPRFMTEQDLHSAQVGNMKNLHYPAPIIIENKYKDYDLKYYIQTTSEKMSYGIFLMVHDTPDGQTFVFTVKKDKNKEALLGNAISTLESALCDGYDARFMSHVGWWKNFWDKSYVHIDDELFENNWYLSNYYLGSSSRKGYYPMPLQGVWTADNGLLPPWKGDYHHNLNTQLTYLSYLKSNHINEGECFTDYLLSLEEKAEDFAREFYKVDEGLCLPSVMDIEGNALGGWPMYAMNPSNIAWLCDSISDLYDYTGDIEFMKCRAYPFIKKFGIFLSKLLVTNSEGKLVLPFSSSPEVHDNSARSFLTPNSSYDLALIRNLYEDLIRFAYLTDNCKDICLWQSIYQKLDTMHLDENNSIMLSRDEKPFEAHHMLSHLISIHPLRQLRYDNDDHKKIIDASMASVEAFGYDLYVGYTFVQCAEIYAIQRQGNKAYDMLKLFWEDFCLQNGFHCNGDYKKKHNMFLTYRPFTLEGNMCACDALQEMLLQDHFESMIISPAVPDNFKNYSFKLRSKKGVIVEVVVKNGELNKVDLEAYRNTEFPLYYGERFIQKIKLNINDTISISY